MGQSVNLTEVEVPFNPGKRDWVSLLKDARETPKQRLANKIDCLTHYGGGRLACVFCGETDLDCLSLDHINNDGAQDRKKRKEKGQSPSIYKNLIWEAYPIGYQTLCMNCQFKKEAHRRRHGS